MTITKQGPHIFAAQFAEGSGYSNELMFETDDSGVMLVSIRCAPSVLGCAVLTPDDADELQAWLAERRKASEEER